jgi:hypothetical protein
MTIVIKREYTVECDDSLCQSKWNGYVDSCTTLALATEAKRRHQEDHQKGEGIFRKGAY